MTEALERTGRAAARGARRAGCATGGRALVARIRHGGAARLVVTNHPIGGPVFAGPQIQPWTCQETATDDAVQRAADVQLLLPAEGRSARDGRRVPGRAVERRRRRRSSPTTPRTRRRDDEIETTTTTEGVTVPFIVRLETGYIDRDQYAIATLFDPEQAVDARPRRSRSSTTGS